MNEEDAVTRNGRIALLSKLARRDEFGLDDAFSGDAVKLPEFSREIGCEVFTIPPSPVRDGNRIVPILPTGRLLLIPHSRFEQRRHDPSPEVPLIDASQAFKTDEERSEPPITIRSHHMREFETEIEVGGHGVPAGGGVGDCV